VDYACTSVSNLPEHANRQSGNSYPLHSCKLAFKKRQSTFETEAAGYKFLPYLCEHEHSFERTKHQVGKEHNQSILPVTWPSNLIWIDDPTQAKSTRHKTNNTWFHIHSTVQTKCHIIRSHAYSIYRIATLNMPKVFQTASSDLT
jgi:hypothetical protein